jgi:hypothetical protein
MCWPVLVLLLAASAHANEDEIVTLLLNSKDFHVVQGHDFVSEMDENGIAFLTIDEVYVRHNIVAKHNSHDEARQHLLSFLEVKVTHTTHTHAKHSIAIFVSFQAATKSFFCFF